ncbi:MAG: hypothetical protein HY021_09325 [Burkholderiales bacterium]|nr:hypothetical protein [Burkholderiales bacterium]
MTLQQLSTVKHWHITHNRERSLEYQVWDAMLTCWVLGWVGVPAALVLAPRAGLVACALLHFAPAVYVWLRRLLHRRAALRCDWLGSLGRPPA